MNVNKYSTVVMTFLLSCIIQSMPLNAQNIDSLYRVLSNAKETKKELIRQEILSATSTIKEEDKARKALKLAQQHKFKLAEAEASFNLGKLYANNNKAKNGIKILLKAKAIFQDLNLDKKVLEVLLVLNYEYSFNTYFKETIEGCEEAIALANKLGDKNALGESYMSLSYVYYSVDLKEKSLLWANKGLEIYKKNHDEAGLIEVAIQFSRLEKSPKDKIKPLLEVLETIPNNTPESQEARCRLFIDLSVNYIELGEYAEAEKWVIKGIEIAYRLNYREGIAILQSYSADINYKLHQNYEKAAILMDSSLQYEMSVNGHYYVVYCAGYLVDIYEKLNAPTKALEYSKIVNTYSDSLLDVNEREMKNSIEIEQNITAQKAEIENLKKQRKTGTLIFALVLSFIVSIILILLRQQRINRKHSEVQTKLMHELENDKNTIQLQADKLRHLGELKAHFFANVSHELRTPLTLILGPINQLLKNVTAENIKEQLLIMRRNGQNLLQLIEEILDLSKFETHELELNETATEFYPYIRRVFSTFESHATYLGIQLQLNYNLQKHIKLSLDKKKFEKIINNLLSNALKFTPTEGKVMMKVNDKENWIEIIVEDTGIGIHSTDLPHIFERYYQTKKTSSTAGGIGIGLALSQEYAKLFGGTLTVESEPEKGSVFTFKFPKKEVFGVLGTDENIELSEPIIIRHIAENKPSFQTKLHSVLIVEDNKDMRFFIKDILLPFYNVITASNGKEALKVLETQDCQLIVSDIMMPIMDGYTFLTQVKANKHLQHLPVIMLTAKISQDDKLAALRIGVDDYLTKPFDAAELLVRIENLLNNYERRIAWKEYLSETDTDKPVATPIVIEENYEWLQQLENITKKSIDSYTFSIDFIAEELNISKRQLYRKIKTATGLTPNQYIQEIRLQKAKELLEENKTITLKELSYAVGFSTPNYLEQLYQKRFGKSIKAKLED